MAIKPSVKGKKPSTRPSKTGSSVSNKTPRRPLARQQKTKPGTHNPTSTAISKHKKRRTYTDVELNLPVLNTITPPSAGPSPRGSGKKKNKIYIDDRESMMTIIALVNAEKDGQIESKMVKMRRMEEIRDARRVEAEKKEEERRRSLEGVKRGFKRRPMGNGTEGERDGKGQMVKWKLEEKLGKKSVSFA